MPITEVAGAGPLLDAVYADVLTPAFPPEELVPSEALGAALASGDESILVSVDDHGTPVGAAVADWFPGSRVLLLSYLATRVGQRASGLGSALLEEARATWAKRWDPDLVVAEIEHPSAHAGSEAYGDPGRRVRFYARHGVRPLDLPYFQPPLRRGGPRVYGLMLCVLSVADRARGAEPDTVDGPTLESFLRQYLSDDRLDDPAATALLAATRRTGGVRQLDFDDLDRVPCSVAPGSLTAP